MKRKEETPLVSVIMPTYNRAAYIRDAIESVLAQTHTNHEIIIIDNFSQDETETIVAEYRKKHDNIVYRKFANNGVVAASRNAGMKVARGRYIAFLDSDDLWVPEKLEKQVRILEENPEVFLVYSRFYIKKESKVVGIGPKHQKLYRGAVFEKLFGSVNFIGCLTVMIRNDKKEKYYFNTDKKLIAFEDYEMWLRISRKHKVEYIDEPLAIYRMHRDNLSSNLRSYYEKNLYFMKLYENRVPRRLLLERYWKFYLHYCLLWLFRRTKDAVAGGWRRH
ncbi:MAG: glycosyltransferase family 2 protein [Candidatus Hydrogenedentota bacterium]|nr:MAG: glycosyltransferase family 2 protein [Candidatus Hydrogenedentota bacterium]